MTIYNKQCHSEAAVAAEPSATWLLEARRRAEELDNGVVEPVPSMEVMRKARMLVRSIAVD